MPLSTTSRQLTGAHLRVGEDVELDEIPPPRAKRAIGGCKVEDLAARCDS
jgi:hypothetical protein